MARGQNFFYQSSPVEAIGASLGKALFGDPEAAAKQAQARSEAELTAARTRQALASAGYDDSRTTGQNQMNTGSMDADSLIRSLVAPSAPAAPAAGADYYPEAAPAPQAFDRRNLAAVIGALSRSQGDKVDTSETIGALTAILGSDEDARRGLIAQGHTPGKDFALTADRADEVAGIENAADLAQALGVARINHESDIPVANIQATTQRRGQDVRSGDTRHVAALNADTRLQVAGSKGATGFSLISDVLPGARMTGGERTPERNREVGGVANSKHLTGDGIEAYDVRVGTGARTFADAKAAMQRKYGARLIEAIDESKKTNGTGPHWHFAVQSEGKPGKAAAAKPPKGISTASSKLLDGELAARIKSEGVTISPRVQTAIRSRAITLFQQTGNPVASVQRAMADALNSSKQNIAARAKPAGKPAAGGGGLRAQAMAAIAQGAPRSAVAARFKQQTGQAL